MSAGKETDEFVISRVFDAPRDLVWRAFTEPEHMKQWWGPKGFTVDRFEHGSAPRRHLPLRHEIPGRPRDVGQVHLPRDRAAGTAGASSHIFSDESGGITRHPMSPSWPLQMLSTFTFEDAGGGKTKFTVRWAPYNATEEERKTFDAGRDSMNQGWGGTLDQLAAYLAKAK